MNVYQNHNTFGLFFRHANKIKRLHFSHAGCSSEIPQIPGCRRTPVTRSLNNSSVHVSGISDVICNDRAPPCQVLCHRLPEYICCKAFIFNFVLKRMHAKYNGTRQDTVYLHYMFIYNDEFQNKKKKWKEWHTYNAQWLQWDFGPRHRQITGDYLFHAVVMAPCKHIHNHT